MTESRDKLVRGGLDVVTDLTADHLASLNEPLNGPVQYRLAAFAAALRPGFGEAVATAVCGSQADFHLVALVTNSARANPWVELTGRGGRTVVERADLTDEGVYARRVLLDGDADLIEAMRDALAGTQLWSGRDEVGQMGIGPSARVWCRDRDRYAAVRFWFLDGSSDWAAHRFFGWLTRATPGRLRRRARFYRTPVARWFV